jgi:hypothetical protein
MIRIFLMAVVLVSSLLAGIAKAERNAAGEYLWTCVGCNPSRDDPAYVLSQSTWPQPVQTGLLAAVRSGPGRSIVLLSGQYFDFGSEGGKRPGTTLIVIQRIRAQWSLGDARQAADLWQFVYEGVQYNFVRVHRCGNYNGWHGNVPPPPPGPPYGHVPQADCYNCCP